LKPDSGYACESGAQLALPVWTDIGLTAMTLPFRALPLQRYHRLA